MLTRVLLKQITAYARGRGAGSSKNNVLPKRNVQIQKLIRSCSMKSAAGNRRRRPTAARRRWRLRSAGNRTGRVAGGSEGIPGRVIEVDDPESGLRP